ncbi:hypothetical protein VM1G_04442 [Cytospora mali]|uniref:Uncharacterized protein n=1 Tax=Cytospora mali TaxID=578113 RepID=A0A194VWY8_CYTMA|nr:hypothetical protein VM1G_04442 [Valsa mali]
MSSHFHISSGAPPSPPPSYGDLHGGDPANKQKKSLAQKILSLFRTHSHAGPRIRIMEAKNIEILVHEARPRIIEVAVEHCDEQRRRVAVEVQVSASVTARSRYVCGRPVISASAASLVQRTACAPYQRSRRGDPLSVALATEKATRKAAEEAHKRAVELSTMSATARVLEKAAAQGRVA